MDSLVWFDLDTWRAIGLSLVSRGIWALGAFAIAGGFGAFARDRRKFSGRWRFLVDWHHAYAEHHLFGRPTDEPHSIGRVSMTYGIGERRRDYWGLSFFELIDGTKAYARLCVEFTDIKIKRRLFGRAFPFFGVSAMQSLDLHSKVRQPLTEFNYGPWVRYRVHFDHSSSGRLEGRILLVSSGEEVATLLATRDP